MILPNDQLRHAGVVGSPIGHSRSPQLHLAAYKALGLPHWTYQRIECDASQLRPFVLGLGPEWVGLSVTMPNKFAALSLADRATDRARLIGSANTLVHDSSGWLADNTDVDGIMGSLGPVGGRGLILGAGGTARAAVVGLARGGITTVTISSRRQAPANSLIALAHQIGLIAYYCPLNYDSLASITTDIDVLVNTLPAHITAEYLPALCHIPQALDVIYDPWPTPLACVIEQAGGTVASGLTMLLHQAFSQVQLFTGQPAPREVMRQALHSDAS